MNWNDFSLYVLIIVLFWFTGVSLLYLVRKKRMIKRHGIYLIAAGTLLLGVFIGTLWANLERPPLKTLGETRLWYSFFLPVIGLITYARWKYKWFLAYSLGMAGLFLVINSIHPENQSKTLMPALQSPWFVPHVVVYLLAYALLAASCLIAAKGLYDRYANRFEQKTLDLADNMVYIGFSFLTLGLLFGALWAKEAWGHYWTWDPKETWALLTWLAYLVYMHFRNFQPRKVKAPLWTLAIAFIVLLICWFGINYLPSAQESIHSYGD